MANQLVWLVTGCSSGFGEALVHSILARGDKVIATARPRGTSSGSDRLASLESAGAAVLELDVAESQEALDAKAKQAWNTYGHVDVLVNNAGYIDAGVFEEISEEFLINSLRHNALGPLNLTRSFLPLMRARRSGTLLFMSSIGAYHSFPMGASYVGSKGLLETLVPSLAAEVAPFNLRACLVTPGYFRTTVFAPGNMHHRAPRRIAEYEEMRTRVTADGRAMDGNQPGDPAKGAELIVDAVRGERGCVGRTLPLRLPVGDDAFGFVRENCEERLRICDEWEGVMSATRVV